MPNAQSEYPLTLAEVLFDELEITCEDIDESEIEIEVVFTEIESRGLALIRAICKETNWDDVEEKIDEIRSLPALGRKELEQICRREKMKVDPSGSDQYDVIWKCK